MYRELPIETPLREVSHCKWLRVAGAGGSPVRVVPDACIDVIWMERGLVLAGPDTRPMLSTLAPGSTAVGIRFATGHGQRLVAAPADALRDARTPLETFWGDRARSLQDKLAAEHDPVRALAVLEAAVARTFARAPEPDALVTALVQQLESERAEQPNVARLARHFGLSERQLLRRCQAQLGYGPKVLARVLRFQGFLRLLRAAPQRSLAELALSAGYADQAHLGHEVAELAGVPPGQLRREAQAAAAAAR